MNPILLEFMLRSAVEGLPPQMREIYQFIERKENQLEEIAADPQHFMRLMQEDSPYRAAAVHFGLELADIQKVMDEAQTEIERSIRERESRMKWVDCSDIHQGEDTGHRAYLFMC
ncbi:hypothetical protein [Bacillus massiliglaciei]|uniref:hypothetical protein n=1 Tax=Bacillus massiliglaciei TaxID=1816693 RepID=UPI000DA5F824|nr:hypothetical protein [Bacillus massiliglaciei]